jgi:hypothetical protein
MLVAAVVLVALAALSHRGHGPASPPPATSAPAKHPGHRAHAPKPHAPAAPAAPKPSSGTVPFGAAATITGVTNLINLAVLTRQMDPATATQLKGDLTTVRSQLSDGDPEGAQHTLTTMRGQVAAARQQGGMSPREAGQVNQMINALSRVIAVE